MFVFFSTQLVAFIIFGIFLSGPLGHMWLKFLNGHKTSLKGQSLILYKVPWFFLSVFHSVPPFSSQCWFATHASVVCFSMPMCIDHRMHGHMRVREGAIVSIWMRTPFPGNASLQPPSLAKRTQPFPFHSFSLARSSLPHTQIALDRLAYGPAFNLLMMSFVYKLSGQNWKQVLASLQKTFWSAQVYWCMCREVSRGGDKIDWIVHMHAQAFFPPFSVSDFVKGMICKIDPPKVE